MQSKGALKWLARLDHPRSISSLVVEVYGEASFYACLFEATVADLLNYHGLHDGSLKEFNTDEHSLSKMLQVVRHRKIFTTDNLAELDEAREARNKLVHRTMANRMIASNIDKELLLADIDDSFSKVFRGFKIAEFGLEELASQLGITREKITSEVDRVKSEAELEDNAISQLISNETNRSG